MSCITLLAVTSSFMFLLDSISILSNLITVELDLSNSNWFILITSKVVQNMISVELLLSTNNLYAVKLATCRLITSVSSSGKCAARVSSTLKICLACRKICCYKTKIFSISNKMEMIDFSSS